MMRHRRVRNLLYEYLCGELNSSKQKMIEHHLAGCEKCSRELDELKSAIDVLDDHRTDPSSERPQEFWNTFAYQVQDRIRHREYPQRTTSAARFIEWVFVMHRRSLVLLGSGVGALVILVIGLFLYRQPPPRHEVQIAEQPLMQQEVPVEVTSDRLHQYFRKSKVLLVGIANMKVDEEEPVDLSAERRISRDLIEEARFLQSQPLDRRSEKLIGDLEKILIELANMKEHHEMPNIEILRGGIHQENLLFKIRMAESMYDTARIVHTMNRY